MQPAGDMTMQCVKTQPFEHAIDSDATSDAAPVFYAQTYTTHRSTSSDMNRRRRRGRSSLLLLELIFPELLEEPLPRQLVVAVEQPA